MKCPECGRVCEKGTVSGRKKYIYTTLDWYPDEESNFPFYKESVCLRLQGEGYYCENCMVVFATFDAETNKLVIHR